MKSLFRLTKKLPQVYQQKLSKVYRYWFSELYFRHMYMLANGPGHQDRVESFHNYCEMFNYIINPEDKVPVNLELPNQWLWDIIDEFIYQFQNYSQYRSKLQSKSQEEIALIQVNKLVLKFYKIKNKFWLMFQKSWKLLK